MHDHSHALPTYICPRLTESCCVCVCARVRHSLLAGRKQPTGIFSTLASQKVCKNHTQYAVRTRFSRAAHRARVRSGHATGEVCCLLLFAAAAPWPPRHKED